MQLSPRACPKESVQSHLGEKVAIRNTRLIIQLSDTDELLHSLQHLTARGNMGHEWLPRWSVQFQGTMNLPGHFH